MRELFNVTVTLKRELITAFKLLELLKNKIQNICEELEEIRLDEIISAQNHFNHQILKHGALSL